MLVIRLTKLIQIIHKFLSLTLITLHIHASVESTS